jgi:hypothetical protein
MNMVRSSSISIVVLVLFISAVPCAQCHAAQPSPIDSALASKEPAQIDRAVGEIRASLVGPPRCAGIDRLKGQWLHGAAALPWNALGEIRDVPGMSPFGVPEQSNKVGCPPSVFRTVFLSAHR